MNFRQGLSWQVRLLFRKASVTKVKVDDMIARAVMRIKKLRGLTALTSDRRHKYRPRNCNGDATGRLGLAHAAKSKKQIDFRSVCGRCARERKTNSSVMAYMRRKAFVSGTIVRMYKV